MPLGGGVISGPGDGADGASCGMFSGASSGTWVSPGSVGCCISGRSGVTGISSGSLGVVCFFMVVVFRYGADFMASYTFLKTIRQWYWFQKTLKPMIEKHLNQNFFVFKLIPVYKNLFLAVETTYGIHHESIKTIVYL